MKQHFVTFESPGIFFNEETTKPIDSWDIEKAKEMAKDIVERYNQTPYAFQFTTRERGENELDSRETKRSGRYFLGGTVYSLAEMKAKNDKSFDILISNMECNNWGFVIKTPKGNWQPFTNEDSLI